MDRERCEDILDVRHFHAVFTIPSELNQIVMQNPATLYRILFKTTADTIRELASDPNYLGIVPGFTSILHTWGQNLSFHPHVHMVITGGGMIPEDKWKSAGKKFFLPVKVLSRQYSQWKTALVSELPRQDISRQKGDPYRQKVSYLTLL